MSALLDDMRRSRFGWRQVSASRCGRPRAAVARVRGRHRFGPLAAAEHRLADRGVVDERRTPSPAASACCGSAIRRAARSTPRSSTASASADPRRRRRRAHAVGRARERRADTLARRRSSPRATATPRGSVTSSRRSACATSWSSTAAAPGNGRHRARRSASRRRARRASSISRSRASTTARSSTRTTRGSRAARSCPRRRRSRRRTPPARRTLASAASSDAAALPRGVRGPVSGPIRPAGHAALGRGRDPGWHATATGTTSCAQRRVQLDERVRDAARAASVDAALPRGQPARSARDRRRCSRGSLALVVWRRTRAAPRTGAATA